MAAAKSQQRKQHLVDAASRVISERGFAGTSVRAVAEQAQVSAGSVLYHFDSFDHLVEAAVRGAVEEMVDHRRKLAEVHTDPVDRLRATIEAGIPETISDDLKVVYQASAGLRENYRYRQIMALLLERQVGLYQTVIEVGIALGAFVPRLDVNVIADNLVALEDAYDLYLLDPENWQRDRYLQNTLRFAELALDCELMQPDEREQSTGFITMPRQAASPRPSTQPAAPSSASATNPKDS